MHISGCLWNGIRAQWQKPLCSPQKRYCLLSVAVKGINFLHKTLVAVAAIIAFLATPLMASVDWGLGRDMAAERVSILGFYEGGVNSSGDRLKDILRSLRLHGLKAESEALFSALKTIYNQHQDVIGSATFSHWRKAAQS